MADTTFRNVIGGELVAMAPKDRRHEVLRRLDEAA